MTNNIDRSKCEKRPAYGFRKKFTLLQKISKISERELAEYCHISHQTISKYELGQRSPTTAVLVLLAEKLGISVDALLLGEIECTNDKLTA